MLSQTPDDCPCSRTANTPITAARTNTTRTIRRASSRVLIAALCLMALIAFPLRAQVCTNDLQGPDDEIGRAHV